MTPAWDPKQLICFVTHLFPTLHSTPFDHTRSWKQSNKVTRVQRFEHITYYSTCCMFKYLKHMHFIAALSGTIVFRRTMHSFSQTKIHRSNDQKGMPPGRLIGGVWGSRAPSVKTNMAVQALPGAGDEVSSPEPRANAGTKFDTRAHTGPIGNIYIYIYI